MSTHQPIGEDGYSPSTEGAALHVRGSTGLLVGRLFDVAIDLVTNVLMIRHLSQSEFGLFAYALAVASVGSSIALFGLSKAVSRYIPQYEENGHSGKVLGAVAVSISTTIVISVIVVVAAHLAIAAGILRFDNGTSTPATLVILMLLIPIQALRPLVASLFAAFADTKAIFLFVYVLAPLLQLIAVGALVVFDESLMWLAGAWVVTGAVGLVAALPRLRAVLKSRGYFGAGVRRSMQAPFRELYSYGVSLLSAEALMLIRGPIAPIIIGTLSTTVQVAEYRAVFPHSRLNLLVQESFKFLFMPAAARLVARGDDRGLEALYRSSILWVTLMTFPIFALTFAFAPALVDMLYGPRYADSAAVMRVLALGFYFSASVGFAGLVLRAFGRFRSTFSAELVTGLVSLGAYVIFIPSLGAMGAAVVMAASVGLQAILYHLAVRRVTDLSLFGTAHLTAYATVSAGAVALVLAQGALQPPIWVSLLLAAVVSLALIRVNRSALSVATAFPEVGRARILKWLLR